MTVQVDLKKDFYKTAQNLNIDFISLRFEDQISNIIEINEKGKIETLSKRIIGGIVEAQKNGSIGSAVFTGYPDIVSSMIEASRIALKLSDKKNFNINTESIEKKFTYNCFDHPDLVKTENKVLLLKGLKSYVKNLNKNAVCSISYRDICSRQYYFTNFGTDIFQENVYSYITPSMGVNYNNRLSLIRENLGGKGGFNILKNLNSDFKRILKSAEVQSKAETLKSGIYPVILDTKLSGLFLHEAVGHLFEADYLCDNIKLSEFMMTGNKIASDCFSAWDDATIPNANGSYEYDDQGVKSSKTELIRNGKIISYLHDKETAHFFNQKETGNSRALNFYYHPQVRMSNTYISPGEYSLDELMKKMDKGFYLKGTVNGETGMENFSFRSAEAFAVKNGCIDKPVIAPLLTGNIFKTLKNIEGCSSKMKIHTGFCGKNGQIPLPVSFGGPEILVDQLVLG